MTVLSGVWRRLAGGLRGKAEKETEGAARGRRKPWQAEGKGRRGEVKGQRLLQKKKRGRGNK